MADNTTTITTDRYRRISVIDSSGSLILGISSTLSPERVQARLTPQEARRIIDALEPMAAPPRTALDIFNEFPLGQVFTRGHDTQQRVKVSETHYARIHKGTGEALQHRADHALQGEEAAYIKAVA